MDGTFPCHCHFISTKRVQSALPQPSRPSVLGPLPPGMNMKWNTNLRALSEYPDCISHLIREYLSPRPETEGEKRK